MLMAFSLIFTIIIPISPITINAADEYDGLRKKYKIKLTGCDLSDPYNLNDQYIKLSISNLDGKVYKYLSTMNSVCCWDDVMNTSETDPNGVHSIIGRLNIMATGWATYGSVYYNNAELLNKIINGLEWFYNNRYNENTTRYGNWYQWEIDIPLDLNNTVVLLYDQLEPLQRTNYMNAVDHFSPNVYYLTEPSSTKITTGANRILKCMVVGIRAILVKDTVKLQEASDGMSDVFQYTTSLDGFYTDGSFIQHSVFPYAGSYGKSLLVNISEMLWLLSGSTWESSSPYKGNVYQWIFDTYEPALFKGELFSSVRGRDIARQTSKASSGFEIISAILTLSEMPSNPNASVYKSIVKYHLQTGFQDSYYRTCGNWYVRRAEEILNSTQITPRPELTGNYQFYNEDRIVQRSQGWAFDIATHSARIGNFESINNENLKGWYTGDGMTYLYTNPSDYAFNFWPTVDPHRLPGITVDRCTSRPDSLGSSKSSNTWVGGVSLGGLYGTAGMDFRQHNSNVTPEIDLSAKKSWFMFDDEIVSLGAGINSTSGRTIETVMDNRLINSLANNPLTVNGTTKSSALGWSETMNNVNWIHLDGTGGYVFPDGMTVNGLRERREGNYSDINGLYYDKANDEFNSTVQESAWMWIREDSAKHSLPGTALNVTTQKGTLEGVLNTTKNILLANAPQYDFYSETKLALSPSTLGQEAGLILYADDDNYVYISRVYTASGQKIAAVSESGGTSVKNTFSDTYGATVYFRIEKRGNDYLLYAGNDGQNWGTALYTYTNTMAGTDGVNSNLRMGLFAQNGNNSGTPEITASFDYFHLKLVRNYLTLWTNHGTNPSDKSYSYITLPGKTAQEVGSYSSNPDVSILKNDKTVQAVKENTLGIIGANFWSAGSVSYITAYDPAAVMVKDQNNSLEISVSDPTHTRSRSKIKVELCKSGLSVISKDPTVTVLQMSPTIILEVDITGTDATKGKSHNITVSYDPLAPTLLPHTMIKLPSVQDAHVIDGAYAGNNYGNEKIMLVKNSGTTDSGYNRETYLKFDMSSINEDIVIESAKLYLFGSVNDSNGTESDVKAYGIDNDGWEESTIKWSTKPTAGAEIGSAHIAGRNDWYEMDVTSYVNTQYEGDKVVSISLAQASKGLSTEFFSKENTSSPYLVLTLASPSKFIAPEADAYVNAGDLADNNYGSSTVLMVKNSSNANTTRKTYFKFDLNSINGEVASAKLYAYGRVSDSGGTEVDNKIYGVDNDSWTESTIKWNIAPDASTYLSTVHTNNQLQWREFDVTSYVKSQCSGDKKASFVILQDATPGLYTYFNSKESSSKQPCLKIITYKKINVDVNPEADAFVRDGAYTEDNYGTATSLIVKKSTTGNNRQAYLKFDLSSISGVFASAKLYAYGRINDSNGTSVDNKIYSVDDDSWTESTIKWTNKKPAVNYLSAMSMTTPWAWRGFDVTSYVQSQYSGDKKASFVILQDGSTGFYTEYKSKEYTSKKPYLRITYLVEP